MRHSMYPFGRHLGPYITCVVGNSYQYGLPKQACQVSNISGLHAVAGTAPACRAGRQPLKGLSAMVMVGSVHWVLSLSHHSLHEKKQSWSCFERGSVAPLQRLRQPSALLALAYGRYLGPITGGRQLLNVGFFAHIRRLSASWTAKNWPKTWQ